MASSAVNPLAAGVEAPSTPTPQPGPAPTTAITPARSSPASVLEKIFCGCCGDSELSDVQTNVPPLALPEEPEPVVEEEEEPEEEPIDYETPATKIISLFRMLHVRHRVQALRRRWHRPFVIRILRASGLAKTDILGSADPFVVVTALQPGCQHAHANTDQALYYKTKHIPQTTEPEWNDEIVVSGCNGMCSLVFTLLDRDYIQITSFDFLGQAKLSVHELMLWDSGLEPFTMNLPLGEMVESVYSHNGNKMSIASGRGSGELLVEFVPSGTLTTVSNWGLHWELVRQSFSDRLSSGHLLMNKKAGNQWQKRWLVLTLKHGIVCYETPQDLNKTTCVLPAKNIGHVTILDSFEGYENVLRIDNGHDDGHPLYAVFPTKLIRHNWELKLKVIRRQALQAATDADPLGAAEEDQLKQRESESAAEEEEEEALS